MKRICFIVLMLHNFAYAQIIVPIAGNGVNGFSNGPATASKLNLPLGIALDDSNSLFICDYGNNRLRKVHPTFEGVITTIAGTGLTGYYGDGEQATNAMFRSLYDVSVDHKGNIYIADAADNRIRKIAPNGIITTVVGTGLPGYNGDGISATTSMLNEPMSVKVDDTGNIYIADRKNYRVRKVDTFGIITTIAGTGTPGYTGDWGFATSAQINGPVGIAISNSGTIYFSDSIRVRKINNTGIISTVAGNGMTGFTGDGGNATSASIEPAKLAVDKEGQLYIADGSNNKIRKVGLDGIITRIAGTGLVGFEGDWGDPLLASVCFGSGIAINPDGDIYYSNYCGNTVKMITTKNLNIPLKGTVYKGMIHIYPNPSKGQFTVNFEGSLDKIFTVIITDCNGNSIGDFKIKAGTPKLCPIKLLPGSYQITLVDLEGNIITNKLIVD